MSHPQEAPNIETAPLNLRDSMLQLAHDICTAEVIIPSLQPNTVEEQWGPIDLTNSAIFATPLLLPYVSIERNDNHSFRVTAAEFTAVDEETTVSIRTTDGPLDNDSFVRYFYDQFRRTYDSHQHVRCNPILYISRLVQVYIPETGLFDVKSYNG
jgi:hypothetical protein